MWSMIGALSIVCELTFCLAVKMQAPNSSTEAVLVRAAQYVRASTEHQQYSIENQSHKNIPGFDQGVFSHSHVLCVGAGGIVSMIAPTLARKGIGRISLLDNDIVEKTNLNRQRFYI